MNTYYYLLNGKQEGPATVDEIAKLGLGKDTLVWRTGMPQWLPIAQVEELKVHVAVAPPPPPSPGQQPQTPPPHAAQSCKPSEPTNYLAYSIIATLLCCLPAGIVSIIYANKANSLWSNGAYGEAEKAKNNARIWLFVSIGAGVLSFILIFIVSFLSAL